MNLENVKRSYRLTEKESQIAMEELYNYLCLEELYRDNIVEDVHNRISGFIRKNYEKEVKIDWDGEDEAKVYVIEDSKEVYICNLHIDSTYTVYFSTIEYSEYSDYIIPKLY